MPSVSCSVKVTEVGGENEGSFVVVENEEGGGIDVTLDATTKLQVSDSGANVLQPAVGDVLKLSLTSYKEPVPAPAAPPAAAA